jgi:hypothetical protein
MASGESNSSFTKRGICGSIDGSCSASLHGYAIWPFVDLFSCWGWCSWGICCLDAKAEEPKITWRDRRDRAEMEEFETRLEGDFISRDGLREGVENLVKEGSGGDKLEGANEISISLGGGKQKSWAALGAGQADDSEFRVGVGQPTVFLTIALKRPLRLHIELSSQKSPEDSNDMPCGICLSSRLCPSIGITTIPSTHLRRQFAFLTVSSRLSRCPRAIRQPITLRRYSMLLQLSTRG